MTQSLSAGSASALEKCKPPASFRPPQDGGAVSLPRAFGAYFDRFTPSIQSRRSSDLLGVGLWKRSELGLVSSAGRLVKKESLKERREVLKKNDSVVRGCRGWRNDGGGSDSGGVSTRNISFAWRSNDDSLFSCPAGMHFTRRRQKKYIKRCPEQCFCNHDNFKMCEPGFPAGNSRLAILRVWKSLHLEVSKIEKLRSCRREAEKGLGN